MGSTYESLKLEGSKADAALDCMRKAGVMPSNQDSIGSMVTVEASGRVGIEVYGSSTGAYLTEESNLTPAQKGVPAKAVTPELQVVGKLAEKLRQKALTCVSKSVGAEP
jgi:hypothetical protein